MPSVDRTTLSRWAKAGIIKAVAIGGGRVRTDIVTMLMIISPEK